MNYNKEAIIEAFLSLLEEESFTKITVKDIVERCGVNRNTFYYHFQDIPSLLQEVLKGRIDQLIAKHCKIGSLADCISITVNYFMENKKAVMHVYRSLPREVFIGHLDYLLRYFVKEYIDGVTVSMEIGEEDKKLFIRFFKCMLVGIFLDWLDADMGYDLLGDSLRVYELQGDASLRLLLNASQKK